MGIGGTVRAASLLLGAALTLVITPPVLAWAAPTATFEWGECPVEIPEAHAERVRCGVLTVPESRSGESERVVRLPVAYIASRSSTPEPDPLVFPTSGGPGAGSFSALWYFLDYAGWAADHRDIIVVEQRGDAMSEPTLDCPELDTGNRISDGRLDDDDASWFAGMTACHERLTTDGVDLAAYTSASSAADLADLRILLGYDQWNLYGISYGTRLALTTMRDEPEGLRAVILDGVYPPNANLHRELGAGFAGAVRSMIDGCAGQAACAAAYPDLEASLVEILDRLRRTPETVTVSSPVDGSPVEVTLDEEAVVDGLFDALYDADLTRALPFVIDQLARGSDDVALPLAQNQVDWQDRLSEGSRWSVDCAEEVSFYDDLPPSSPPTDPIAELYPEGGLEKHCGAWPVTATPAVENELVRSDIPTLLMSGGRDPVTPAVNAALAAPGLPRSFSFTFPTMGHGVVWQNGIDECPASIAAAFLQAPTSEPDATCIAAMEPTVFLTVEDIYPTAGVYRASRTIMVERKPLDTAVVAACLAVIVGAVGYGAVTLIRRRHQAPAWAVPAALVAAVAHLVFAGGFYLVGSRTDPLVLGFGVPRSALPLWGSIAVAVLATVVLQGHVIRARARGTGTRTHRVTLSVITLASALLLGWYLAQGLLLI